MLFTERFASTPQFEVSSPRAIYRKTSIEPDLFVSDLGGWVIWTEQALDGDRIMARSFTDTGFGDIREWSSTSGIEYQPTVVLLDDGRLLGVHAAKRSDEYLLIARTLDMQLLSEEHVVWRSQNGIFRPRLLVDASRIWLVFESAGSSTNCLMVSVWDGEQWTAAKPCGPRTGWNSRAALARTPAGAVWCAYDSYQDGRYDVWLQQMDQPGTPIRVSPGAYHAVQPAICSDTKGRLWVAYATNANPARRDPWWLTKWCTVRCVDGTDVYDIPEQPERDVYREDSFQGWEFPALQVTAGGELVLCGQAAHTLRVASCGEHGWSPYVSFTEEHWGSWKPRIRMSGNNPTYMVSMGLQGAQLHRLDVRASDGPPPLLRTHEPLPSRVSAVAKRERPSLTTANGETLKYFFGDLHAHSIYGDATNDIDEIYHRYRDGYGYDFATLTEHDFLDEIILSPSELNMFWDVAGRLTEDGRFVAMYGYEWTSPAIAEHAAPGTRIGEGHRHVICRDRRVPFVSYADPQVRTGASLLGHLKGERALVIPHHTSWAGTDWDAHDPDLQRVVEICSTHGRFEYPGNLPIGYRRDHIHPHKFVLDALDRGYRLGFVGGSDSHGLRWHATEPDGRDSYVPAGTRVGWKEDAYRTGMTAVLAEHLTREALFDGLSQRRCYATSGVPIILDFRVNGQLMGSEITSTSAPLLSVSVTGTTGLREVQVIRSGHEFGGWLAVPGADSTSLRFEITDEIMIPGETHYYYLRVLQADGNMAWSSPIWVSRI